MSNQPTTDLEFLVTVKAYPNPSKGVGEAACIAGVTRKKKLVRIYPVPFRKLDGDQQFSKYQWVSVPVFKASSDSRPETWRPVFERLKVQEAIPADGRDWWARREWVLPSASASLCDIQDRQKVDRTSLGLFQPAEVFDFDWKAAENPNWDPDEISKLSQDDLFLASNNEPLEKIPYSFRYRFRCHDCRTREPHYMKIVDWELMQLYRKMRDECATIEEALRKVKDKYLGDLCGPGKDTYFFVGNTQAHAEAFLVLGVFSPKRQVQGRLL